MRQPGTDLFSLDEDARAAVRAAHVGFVFQSFQLLGNLTSSNVMLPLELQGLGDARSRATEVTGAGRAGRSRRGTCSRCCRAVNSSGSLWRARLS